MKSFSRTMTTCVASAALLLATAGLAQAGDPDAPATDAGEVVESSSAGGAFVSQAGDASVVVPRSTDDPVVLASTNSEAPDDYTFEGFGLALQEDGSVLVLDGGSEAGGYCR